MDFSTLCGFRSKVYRWPGAPFKRKAPSPPATPDQHEEGRDPTGYKIEGRCGQNLHFARARPHSLRLLQVVRHGAQATQRDPKRSWERPPADANLAGILPDGRRGVLASR
jgi:hypothetical protein